MKKPVKKLTMYARFDKRKVIAIALLLSIASLVIARILASSPFISNEPELGHTNNGVAIIDDPKASGGSAVKFGNVALNAKATALTVVGSTVSHAICIDNKISLSSRLATACLQVNPLDNTQAQPGVYDIVNKQFSPIYGASWMPISDLSTALSTTKLRCSNGHSFTGLGPIINNAATWYYGEEIVGSTASIGYLDAGTNVCTSGARGTVSTWDASPIITCSSPIDTTTVFHVSSVPALESAIKNRPSGSEICVAPGLYKLSATLLLKAGMRLIGDPIRRAVIDASGITSGTTSVIGTAGSGVTVANITAQGTSQPTVGCHNCAWGINGGQNWHLYNVQAINNAENGYHSTAPGYLIENSEFSNNGSESLATGSLASSGGVKTTSAGTLKHNVAIGNHGAGLWCDGVSSSVCRGGTWYAVDNYVASSSYVGIHYEIAFNGAVIKNNVLVGNNTTNQSWVGQISVYGSGVIVTGNIINANTTRGHGIYVYNDSRTPPFPYSSNDTVINNYLNGEDVTCSPADTFGANIVCTPNF